jgi:hypothetical protein
MLGQTVTLHLPEKLYHRLANTARATQRSLEDVLLQALSVGSPPGWDDAPPEFQAELAEMDRQDDEALWSVFHAQLRPEDVTHYDELLDLHRQGTLTESQQIELERLRVDADRHMLCKAQAAVLLRWRGHTIPLK